MITATAHARITKLRALGEMCPPSRDTALTRYRIRPSATQLAGVLVTFSGVALIVSAQDLDANPDALAGSALLVCAGVV